MLGWQLLTDLETLTINRQDLIARKSFISPDDLARSELDALYVGDSTRFVNIAKLTIQKFLEACISEKGQFRTFFKRFASFTGNYVVNQNLDKNDHRRLLQIVRLFEGQGEHPPQIVIQDGGYSYKQASLGGLTAGWNERTRDGSQVVRVMDSVDIPIEITCAALDETTIDDLQGFLSLAFGQQQKFLCGWVLKPSRQVEGAYWELILPLTFEVGTKSRAGFHNDPQKQVHSFTCSLPIIFENSTYMTYKAAPVFDMANNNFQILVPTKITLNSTVPVTLLHTPLPLEIYSSDSRIALIGLKQTTYFIYPKRLGRFTLVVAKPRTTSDENQLIYAQKEMEVVLR